MGLKQIATQSFALRTNSLGISIMLKHEAVTMGLPGP